MKQSISVFDYGTEIYTALKKGILLTTKAGDKVNSMTISWGMMGIEWGKPIFITYVRTSRFTRELLDETGEFTINIPAEKVNADILKICGSKSGRNMDKIGELGLTLEDSEIVSAPGIKEFPITLECKVIYRREQDLSLIPENLRNTYYPQDIDGSVPGRNRDLHVAYYGEIVNAYRVI